MQRHKKRKKQRKYIKSKFNMMLKKWFGIAHFNKSYKMKRE